ncbi:MAG: hypothetical protein EHM70_18575, partial [Chloroflexota bacterium]
MAAPLVATKFYRPAARLSEINRPRLFQKLDDQFLKGCPFYLVSAPPGFGKTTLVSAWTRKTNLPTAWLSLEKADNELFRFWRYVIGAFNSLHAGLSPELEEALSTPQALPLDYLIPNLINFLAERPKPFFLVLDDYHLIDNPEIHSLLGGFIDHLPSNGRVVIITRSDPPLHLAVRRSRGQLFEVRVGDLRFNMDEAGEFLNRSMQLDLLQDDVAALEMRTEGWIAGLQLAAISMRDSENPRSFISAFHGEDRFIADYLVEEVLHRQADHIQAFLLQTSLLQRFNAQLCNAITMRKDSAEILARLEADNLFLTPLDNQREWFRYHHLFARLLQKKFETIFSSEDRSLILHRASSECVRQGLLVESVQYLFDSGDEPGAAALIERLSKDIFQLNELPTLMHWAGLLPERLVGQMPGLCISFGWAAHATGHPEQSGHYIEMVEEYAGLKVEGFLALSPEEQRLLPDEILACIVEAVIIKARLLIDQGISLSTLERYLQILAWLVPERDNKPFVNNSPSAMRPIMLFQAGMAYQLSGSPMRAIQAFEETILLSRQQRNHFLVALGMGYLGQIQAAQGRLRAAEKTWRDALTYAHEQGVERDAFFSTALTGLGALAYERNDLEAAERLLREGIGLAKNWAAWQGLVPGYTGLSLALQAKGDSLEALEALDELHRYRNSAPQMIVPAVDVYRALLGARQGKADEDPALWHTVKTGPMEQALALAEILSIRGRPTDAMELLEKLAVEADSEGLHGYLVRILALKAKAVASTGQLESARKDLERALELGEKEGYLRTFLDLGEPVALLLRQINRPDLAVYRSGLLKAFSSQAQSPGSIVDQANALLE